VTVPPVVRVVSRAETRTAATILADAFADYPLYVHACPDGSRRASLSVFFEAMVRYACRHGFACGAGEPLAGVALCLPAPHQRISTWGMLRCGAWRIPLSLGFDFLPRLEQVTLKQEEMRWRLAPANHAYLWALGVVPTARGQGLGGELIDHLIQATEKRGNILYLRPPNRPM
jgi:ribosomal protein S18 acetylase RimI-like enzyme